MSRKLFMLVFLLPILSFCVGAEDFTEADFEFAVRTYGKRSLPPYFIQEIGKEYPSLAIRCKRFLEKYNKTAEADTAILRKFIIEHVTDMKALEKELLTACSETYRALIKNESRATSYLSGSEEQLRHYEASPDTFALRTWMKEKKLLKAEPKASPTPADSNPGDRDFEKELKQIYAPKPPIPSITAKEAWNSSPHPAQPPPREKYQRQAKPGSLPNDFSAEDNAIALVAIVGLFIGIYMFTHRGGKSSQIQKEDLPVELVTLWIRLPLTLLAVFIGLALLSIYRSIVDILLAEAKLDRVVHSVIYGFAVAIGVYCWYKICNLIWQLKKRKSPNRVPVSTSPQLIIDNLPKETIAEETLPAAVMEEERIPADSPIGNQVNGTSKPFSEKATKMSDTNKILLLSTIAALLLLGIAILDSFSRRSGLPSGYFTFLRIVTCAVLVWYCVLLRSPYWRFFLAAGAILYNPVIPIHLDDRGLWCFFNVVTVAALLIAYFRYRKQLTKDAPDEN